MDYSAAETLNHFTGRHDGFEDVLSRFMTGSELLFAGVLLVLWFLVPAASRLVGRRAAVAAAASFALSAVAAQLISGVVDRSRPFVAHPATIHAFLAHARDASFPSDHATAAFAIATAVALRRRSWGAALLGLAAIVAIGRVCLGLHYPGDVIGGALLGAASALVLWVAVLRVRLDRVADALGRLTDAAFRRVRVSGPHGDFTNRA